MVKLMINHWTELVALRSMILRRHATCSMGHGSRRITNTWLNIRKLYWPITSDTVPTPQECVSALNRGLGVDHGGFTVALAAELDLTCG